jgi:hypothetical protein
LKIRFLGLPHTACRIGGFHYAFEVIRNRHLITAPEVPS